MRTVHGGDSFQRSMKEISPGKSEEESNRLLFALEWLSESLHNGTADGFDERFPHCRDTVSS
jgi:hypothetical protein